MNSKKYHPSWLVTWISVGVLVGAVLALATTFFASPEWLVLASCLAVIGFLRRDILAIVLVLLAGLLIGLNRGGNELVAQSVYDNYFGQIVTVSGKVSEDPTYDSDGDIRFKLSQVIINEEPSGGQLWISTSEVVSVRRSDFVVAEGQLLNGFGTIPASIYRASIVEVNGEVYSDPGRDTRDWFAGGIDEAIQEPQASLGAGFLLGLKTQLPEKLDNELRLLGLTHIVVASGYNLTILIRFARRLFAKISRFTALAFSLVLVFGFAQITGFSPSMSRAALIASLSLLAWYYGRKFHPLVLLPFSAAITVLINPSYAWGDIGWLLSFSSFVGVIMLAPLIQQYFWGEKKPNALRQVVIETLSAILFTLPIIAYVFGQYSPLSLLANILVLPLIPLAMLLTFTAGLAGVALPANISSVIGWPAESVMKYMTYVVDKLAQWPLASTEVTFSLTAVIVSYILLVVLIIFLHRRTGYKFRNYNIIE